MSDSEFVTQELKEFQKEQTKIGTGYFEAACSLSILMFIGMAVILGLTLKDLDECEKKPSGHCPYFTNPHPPVTTPGTEKNITEDFTTNVRLPNGNTVPLDPFVYRD